MATPATAVMPVDRTPINVILDNSTNLTLVTVYDNSAGTKAVRVESLNLCSQAAPANNVKFSRLHNSVNYTLGTVAVPLNAGVTGAIARVNALSSNLLLLGDMDSDGIYVIWIPAGQTLQAQMLVQITSPNSVHITGTVKTFE